MAGQRRRTAADNVIDGVTRALTDVRAVLKDRKDGDGKPLMTEQEINDYMSNLEIIVASEPEAMIAYNATNGLAYEAALKKIGVDEKVLKTVLKRKKKGDEVTVEITDSEKFQEIVLAAFDELATLRRVNVDEQIEGAVAQARDEKDKEKEKALLEQKKTLEAAQAQALAEQKKATNKKVGKAVGGAVVGGVILAAGTFIGGYFFGRSNPKFEQVVTAQSANQLLENYGFTVDKDSSDSLGTQINNFIAGLDDENYAKFLGEAKELGFEADASSEATEKAQLADWVSEKANLYQDAVNGQVPSDDASKVLVEAIIETLANNGYEKAEGQTDADFIQSTLGKLLDSQSGANTYDDLVELFEQIGFDSDLYTNEDGSIDREGLNDLCEEIVDKLADYEDMQKAYQEMEADIEAIYGGIEDLYNKVVGETLSIEEVSDAQQALNDIYSKIEEAKEQMQNELDLSEEQKQALAEALATAEANANELQAKYDALNEKYNDLLNENNSGMNVNQSGVSSGNSNNLNNNVSVGTGEEDEKNTDSSVNNTNEGSNGQTGDKAPERDF